MILGDPWLVDWVEVPKPTKTCGIRSEAMEPKADPAPAQPAPRRHRLRRR